MAQANTTCTDEHNMARPYNMWNGLIYFCQQHKLYHYKYLGKHFSWMHWPHKHDRTHWYQVSNPSLCGCVLSKQSQMSQDIYNVCWWVLSQNNRIFSVDTGQTPFVTKLLHYALLKHLVGGGGGNPATSHQWI